MATCEPGHMCFPLKEEDLREAQNLLALMYGHESPLQILQEAGHEYSSQDSESAAGPVLMMVYSDFNVDDLMAVSQLWALKRVKENMVSKPLLIWNVSFDRRDKGQIFEKKLLIKSLMVGNLDTVILANEGDKGGCEMRGDVDVQPHANQHIAARGERLQEIVDRLANFKGDNIHLYVLSPGRGNIGAIVTRLKDQGKWPLKTPDGNLMKWRISFYSGKYNLKGMLDADFQAFSKIMEFPDSSFVDISTHEFFGGDSKHVCTESIGSFCSPSFAERASTNWPLMAASLKLFNDEFLEGFLHPRNLQIGEGSALYSQMHKYFCKSFSLQQFAEETLKD